MSNDVFMTKEGLEKLKEELSELVETKRPAVAQRIQDAREMGDISENAEYDAAKQQQAFAEGRIAELEEIIKNAKVAVGGKNGEVSVGSMVTVHIEGEEETFYIVGAVEADPVNKKISHESPIGSALLGKKIGDKIEIEVPIGNITYTVLKVE